MFSINYIKNRVQVLNRYYANFQKIYPSTLNDSQIYHNGLEVVTYIHNFEMKYLGELEAYVNSACAYCSKYGFSNSEKLIEDLVKNNIHDIRKVFIDIRKKIETSYTEAYDELNIIYETNENCFNSMNRQISFYIINLGNF